jgi:hypothetical protein
VTGLSPTALHGWKKKGKTCNGKELLYSLTINIHEACSLNTFLVDF